MNTAQIKKLDEIKSLLSLHPDGLCITEIAKALNRNRNSISRDLHALLVSGQVHSHAFGTTRIFTLRKRESFFSILDSVRDMVLIIDFKGTIVDANASLLDFLGERGENIIGHYWSEFSPLSGMIPGDFLKKDFHGSKMPIYKKDDLSPYEVSSYPVLCTDGSEGFVIVINDLSAFENLRAENEKDKFILDTVITDSSLFIVQLFPDGRIITGNKPFTSRFFPSSETAKGEDLFSLLSSAGADPLRRTISGLSPKGRITCHTCSMTDHHGNKETIRWKFHGIFGGNGHLREVLGTGSDITDSVRSKSHEHNIHTRINLLSKALTDLQNSSTPEGIFSSIPLHIASLIPGSRVAVFAEHAAGSAWCLRAADTETLGVIHSLVPGGAAGSLPPHVLSPDHSIPENVPAPGGYGWTSTSLFRSFLAQIAPGADLPEWAVSTRSVCRAGVGETDGLFGLVEIFSDREHILEYEPFLLQYLGIATLALRQIGIVRSQRVTGEQFRTIALNAPVPVSIIDRKGRYIYLNPGFSKLFGYTLEDIPDGKTWFLKAFPDFSEQKRAMRLWKEDLASSPPGRVRPRQFRVRCRGGDFRDILFLPVMMSNGDHVVIYQDMTPALDAVLRQNLLNVLFLFSQEAIVLVTHDGRVTSWNPVAERIYGYAAGEMDQKAIVILEPPHLKGEISRILEQVMSGGPVIGHETHHARRDGSVIGIILSAFPLRNDREEVVSVCLLCREKVPAQN